MVSASTFDRLSNAVETLLLSHGFTVLKNERDAAFGSHLTEFGKGDAKYRVVWDGRESWLLTQSSIGASDHEFDNWVDLVLCRMGMFGSDSDVLRAEQKMLQSVAVHLAGNSI